MLARIEIVVGVAVVAVVCIVAGFAIVSGILVAHPAGNVRACVEQEEAVAAKSHKPVSHVAISETCERLLSSENGLR